MRHGRWASAGSARSSAASGTTDLVAATTVRVRGVVVLALTAAATALLAVVPGPAALLIAAAMLAGAARGVFTLLQATAISDRWGAAHYGRLNGLLSAPALPATALGPVLRCARPSPRQLPRCLPGLLAGTAALAAVLATGSTPGLRHAILLTTHGKLSNY